MKLQTTLFVGISNASLRHIKPEDLQGEKALPHLSYFNSDLSGYGWTNLGTAEVTIDLVDRNTLLANAVEALKSERSKIIAEAQLKATQLDSQINQLLAIEMAPAREA